MHRRRFLQGIAATTAVAASSGNALANNAEAPNAADGQPPERAEEGPASASAEAADAASAETAAPATPAGPPPWALLAPLSVGSDVGLGWSIQQLSGVSRGAAVLSLQHEDGTGARIHLCSIAGTPRGVAHSDHIDLMLMNNGDGRLVTHEGIGRVLKTLAEVIRHNERSSAAKASGLMPHALRVGCFRSQRCLT